MSQNALHTSKAMSKNIRESTARINSNKSDIKDFTSRVVTSVPYPASNRLTIKELFASNEAPKIDLLKEHFIKEGRLDESAALLILQRAGEKFRQEDTCIYVQSPVVIVGDLHGQYYDMLQVFDMGGSLENINYLFLGDYVDRGHFSIEIVLYLWSLKILHPKKLILLRGNHECKHLTEHFTFKRECFIKYSQKVFDACIESFRCMPLCAVVNKQLFCVHGGLSPKLSTLNELNDQSKLKRFREPPSSGLMCDLLWSDPAKDFSTETATNLAPFSHNLTRGCSHFYNFDAVVSFLKNNELLCMIRAHEAQDNGFRMYKNREDTGFPSLITIFSAPNYLDVYNNKGAIIVYEKDTMNTKQFGASPHPYWLPNFMDVFTWSLPFVAEKVTELFLFLLKLNIDDTPDKKEIIRVKLVAISRIARMYSKLRERNESLIELRGIAPSSLTYLNSAADFSIEKITENDAENSLKQEENDETLINLLDGDLKIRRKLSLDEIKQLDKLNECLPKTQQSNAFSNTGLDED